MTIIALTTFIELKDAAGKVQHRFQNSEPGKTIQYGPSLPAGVPGPVQSYPYQYLSFIYQGAAKNRTGDNMESTLVLANNHLSMSYVVDAVNNRWNVRVSSCSMNPSTFQVARELAVEHWIVAGMSYDPETIEVLLSSSIDAVGANAPTRVLTADIVGPLPVTGSLSNR